MHNPRHQTDIYRGTEVQRYYTLNRVVWRVAVYDVRSPEVVLYSANSEQSGLVV